MKRVMPVTNHLPVEWIMLHMEETGTRKPISTNKHLLEEVTKITNGSQQISKTLLESKEIQDSLQEILLINLNLSSRLIKQTLQVEEATKGMS